MFSKEVSIAWNSDTKRERLLSLRVRESKPVSSWRKSICYIKAAVCKYRRMHARNTTDGKCGAPKVAVAPHVVVLECEYFIARACRASRGGIRSFIVFLYSATCMATVSYAMRFHPSLLVTHFFSMKLFSVELSSFVNTLTLIPVT